MSELQILGIGLIFILSALLFTQKPRIKSNEPPLVPYTFPIIGHTVQYYSDVPGFLAKCRQKHGEIFSLYLWGDVKTFVGKGSTHTELYRNHHAFDFHEAMDDILPMCGFLNRPHGYFNVISEYAKEFMHDLDRYAERVQNSLLKSYEELVGDGKVIKSPMDFVQKVIAKPIAATIVGEELCDDHELINSFATITADMVPLLSIPPVLDFIYPGFHKVFLKFKFKFFNNPVKTHRKTILSKITPVIHKRVIYKNVYGNSWKRPADILQELIERFTTDKGTVDIESIGDFVINFIFVSVHTTSYTFIQTLYDYVNNPQYHKELLEEAKKVYNENKDSPYYINSQIVKMNKLDNFLKESLRCNTHTTSMFRKTTKDFTFSNGIMIPKGRFCQAITQHIHYDSKSYGPDPNEFDPNRHCNSLSTSPGRDYVAFGTGKEVCPGRFFAVNEVKVAMHFIQLIYNVKSVSGNYVKPVMFAGFRVPSNEGFIFEKRDDSIIQ